LISSNIDVLDIDSPAYILKQTFRDYSIIISNWFIEAIS
jgi:hypothetical protein